MSLGFGAGCASFSDLGISRYYCWGEWECAVGSPESPAIVPTLVVTNFTEARTPSISVGRGAACLVSRGNLYCWGADLLGGCNAIPTLMFPEYTDIESVRLGDGYGCFKRSIGALYCWGSNADGRLGVGEVDSGSRPPQQVVFNEPAE